MHIAIIGGGPAGLMAAETALAGGARVDLYDSMASIGRKFLLAGKGGLNLTHSEPTEVFSHGMAIAGTRSHPGWQNLAPARFAHGRGDLVSRPLSVPPAACFPST